MSSETFAGYTVLTKSMLGVGLLSVASALAQCGWMVGISVSLISPVIMLFSLHLLSRLAFEYKKTQVAAKGASESVDLSFYNVAHRVSPVAACILEVAVVFTSIGSAIAYSFVSGTMLADVIKPQTVKDTGITDERSLKVGESGYNDNTRWLLQLGFAAVLAFPCFMKELKKTTVLNAAAIVCLAYIVLIAVITVDKDNLKEEDRQKTFESGEIWTVFRKISSFTFAYCCTHNLFAVAGGLSNFTVKRLDVISSMATLTGIIFMTITAVLPYYTHGKNVKPNFLDSVKSKEWWATLARVAAALQVSIGFVLVIHPTRNSIIGLIYRGGKPQAKDEFKVRCMVTLVSILVSVGTALLVKKLSDPLDIAGLLGATTMCFSVPAYLFMKAFDYESNKVTWIASAALLLFSVVLYIMGTISIIMTWGK